MCVYMYEIYRRVLEVVLEAALLVIQEADALTIRHRSLLSMSGVVVGKVVVEVLPLRVQHLLDMSRFLVGFHHYRP